MRENRVESDEGEGGEEEQEASFIEDRCEGQQEQRGEESPRKCRVEVPQWVHPAPLATLVQVDIVVHHLRLRPRCAAPEVRIHQKSQWRPHKKGEKTSQDQPEFEMNKTLFARYTRAPFEGDSSNEKLHQ